MFNKKKVLSNQLLIQSKRKKILFYKNKRPIYLFIYYFIFIKKAIFLKHNIRIIENKFIELDIIHGFKNQLKTNSKLIEYKKP